MDYGRLNDDTKIIPLNHPFLPKLSFCDMTDIIHLFEKRVIEKKRKCFVSVSRDSLGPCWEEH